VPDGLFHLATRDAKYAATFATLPTTKPFADVGANRLRGVGVEDREIAMIAHVLR
jgi:hypothetical protein